MKTGGDQEYFFRMDKKSYQQGEEVIVTGMGGDERYDTFQGQIRLYQNGEWIEDQSLSYDIKTKQFHGKYWTSTSGNFAYDILLEKDGVSQKVGEGSYTVQESRIELNHVFLNKKVLLTLADKTGGEYYDWEDRNKIFEQISPVSESVQKTNFFVLNENIYILVFIIFLLTIEWIIRRRLGFL